MADKASAYILGEIFQDARFDVVQYTESIIAEDFLTVVGITEESHLKVAKQTGSTKARFIATESGESDDLKSVLFSGTTKITFGSSTTPGETGAVKDNKIVPTGTAGTGNDCCVIVSDATADGDTGLVKFNGAMS